MIIEVIEKIIRLDWRLELWNEKTIERYKESGRIEKQFIKGNRWLE